MRKWLAPMSTAAWRAPLFAALVDDPGSDEGRLKLMDMSTG